MISNIRLGQAKARSAVFATLRLKQHSRVNDECTHDLLGRTLHTFPMAVPVCFIIRSAARLRWPEFDYNRKLFDYSHLLQRWPLCWCNGMSLIRCPLLLLLTPGQGVWAPAEMDGWHHWISPEALEVGKSSHLSHSDKNTHIRHEVVEGRIINQFGL